MGDKERCVMKKVGYAIVVDNGQEIEITIERRDDGSYKKSKKYLKKEKDA
jgi:hypothetical protein